MQLDITISDVTATIYQKQTHVSHAALHGNLHYTFTVYSLLLTFEDYWLGWLTKQNKNQ